MCEYCDYTIRRIQHIINVHYQQTHLYDNLKYEDGPKIPFTSVGVNCLFVNLPKVLISFCYSDDGEWKVNVENQYGSASSECILTLRVPKNYRKPKFVENLKPFLTKEGLVSFECKVVGFPTPLLRYKITQ